MIYKEYILVTFILVFLVINGIMVSSARAVTAVSKTAEDSFGSAAAVYVINRTDIKRSGATNIADLLRLVPGLQVASTNSNQFAITSRGFNGVFSNKLLVMIDGRSIYNPLFSGVYWGIQDIMLENIKQIEVIRGPGATQWGANAVNGIINIITEPAINTQSNLATFSYGNIDKGSAALRYGNKIKENSYYRLYALHNSKDNFKNIYNRQTNYQSNITKGGFRLDYDEFETDLLTLQGDIYGANQGIDLLLPRLPSGSDALKEDIDDYGGNIIGRWTRLIADQQQTQLQIYYDYHNRNYSLLSRDTKIFDVDFQYSVPVKKRHQLVLGLRYHLTDTDMNGKDYRISFNQKRRITNLYSTFIQDKITLISDKLYLTLGSKFEHNDFTGYESQPSAKISWLLTKDQTLWTSISRAVRTPSIAEDDVKYISNVVNGKYISQQGYRGFDAENLTAYEAGYRIRPTYNSLVDIALFYNDYSDLLTGEMSSASNSIIFSADNKGIGKAFGLEVQGSVNPSRSWELKGGYSFLKLDLDAGPSSTDLDLEKQQGRSPKHQFNIQSRLNLPNNITFDNILYYTSSIRVDDNNLNSIKIPAYFRFDTHIGWQYSKKLFFDFTVQNLFDEAHQEFGGELWSVPNQVNRSFYFKTTFKF